MTDEERREKNRIRKREYYAAHREQEKERRRQYYARHKAEMNAYAREWYAKNRDRVKELHRLQYLKTMCDPDRYARYTETSRRWKQRNKDRLNEKRNDWRRRNKKLARRQWLLERDRRNAIFSQCPELYAEWLAKKRKYNAEYRRRTRRNVRAYVPRMGMRIPEWCAFRKVLDRRSVFLSNNQSKASLMAGRDYRAMQWRENHCDRFGLVCR